MLSFATEADLEVALQNAGLPPNTKVNPPNDPARPFADVRWPPQPEHFSLPQPRGAVAAAVVANCGGTAHLERVSEEDAALNVNMRALYVGLEPRQRELLAIALEGVDRCARRNAVRTSAAEARVEAHARASLPPTFQIQSPARTHPDRNACDRASCGLSLPGSM